MILHHPGLVRADTCESGTSLPGGSSSVEARAGSRSPHEHPAGSILYGLTAAPSGFPLTSLRSKVKLIVGKHIMGDTTVFEFTVNQTPIKTSHEKLSAGDIIRLAIKHGAGGISGKAEDYVLQSLEPEQEFKSDDIVDLLEYKEFITEKSGPTPVAEIKS